MPISFDPGDGRGGSRPPRTDPREPSQPPRTEPEPPDPPPDRWETIEVGRYDIYLTAGDERVCPICGPWSGYIISQGHGPFPPLHFGCRCFRHYHHSDYWTVRIPGSG